MEAVRGLHDLGDYAGAQGHCGVGEGRPEDGLGGHAQFTAFAGAPGVLGVDAGEGGELLAVDDAFPQGKEPFLDRHGSGFPVGVDADLAELVLDRNHRQVFLGDRVQELLDVVRGDLRNRGGDGALFLLGQALVLEELAPFLAEPVQGFPKVFLHLFVPAQIGPELVDAVVQFAFHHLVVDGERVDPGLHQEDLGFHHVLQDGAAHVPVGGPALGLHLLHFALDVRDHDHFVSHDGDGLVHKSALVFLGGEGGRDQQCRRKDDKPLLHINKSQIFPCSGRRSASPVPNRPPNHAFWCSG